MQCNIFQPRARDHVMKCLEHPDILSDNKILDQTGVRITTGSHQSHMWIQGRLLNVKLGESCPKIPISGGKELIYMLLSVFFF